ncbi:MAG: SpoIIE family protein phosphatase [Christensenellales bacterium]|jgi:stage II sporulation protein E
MELKKYNYFAKFKLIIKYALFFVMFYVLMQSGINNSIFPFAIGAFYALVWCNQKVYVLAPLYIVASLLSNFSVNTAIISCFTSLVILFTYMIHFKFKKPMKPYLLVLYALIAQIVQIWIDVTGGTHIALIVANTVLALLFLYALTVFFTAVFIRGITSRLKVWEVITGCLFVMAISNGLSAINFFGFETVKFVGAFAILLTAYCFDIKFSLIYSSVYAVGTLINTSNAFMVAPLVLWALFVNAFRFKNRLIFVFALVVIEAVVGWYFELYYSYKILSFISCISGAVAFLIVPPKVLNNLSATYSSASQNLAMRNIVNRNRDALSKRFNNLSEVFAEMDKVFRSMIKGGLSINEAKMLLKDEVKEKFSVYGKQGKHALRTYDKELDTILLELITIALERKNITLLDIPPFMTTQYSNINALVSIINNTVDQYKQYASFINNIDASKVLIAEQLNGVAKIMRSLADEVGKNVLFDNAKEDRIISELTYNNIICSEAIIYNQNPSILNVSLVVKQEDSMRPKIPTIVSKIVGYPMVVAEINPSSRGGWSEIELKNSPKYNVIFGTAGVAKDTNEVSGDSYSLTRIDNDKFMMALCDGMGNGKKAENDSSLAVGLLENFYKAGFDNQIILSSVNNLLGLGNDEDSFSSLDICVLDLKNGISDFIKLGATTGFVKHTDGISKIKCESLPIGIVREIKPVVEKIVLSAGDVVVLCTDGVTDSFESEDDFENYLKSITSVNPQEISEHILSRALENNGNRAKDDMTVLIARIYEAI